MGSGFKDARTEIEILKDPAAKELSNVLRTYGNLSDSYFDINNRFTANAYLMLDQIIRIMNKYPELKLEIGVHTDNMGTTENNLISSQRSAQVIVNYLASRGVISKRLVAKGYGETKPVSSNFLEKDRKLNRRVEFTIIK